MIRPMTTGRDFRSIGVIGLGTMGAGIAEIFARNGYQVVGVELNDESLERGRQHIQHSTDRAVKRGKLSEGDQQELIGRVTFTTNLSDVKDVDLVVEAVVEQLDLKQGLFRELDQVVRPEAILATNTSSLSVTEISTATSHPGRVVGIHFFNPAPVQKLVEIVRTVVTEPDVLDDVARSCREARQDPRRLRRQGRLHRQHAAVRLPQPRRVDVRGALRQPRGHRRGDALRLRLPDGPARPARPDRSRHRLRDPRHDVQAGP